MTPAAGRRGPKTNDGRADSLLTRPTDRRSGDGTRSSGARFRRRSAASWECTAPPAQLRSSTTRADPEKASPSPGTVARGVRRERVRRGLAHRVAPIYRTEQRGRAREKQTPPTGRDTPPRRATTAGAAIPYRPRSVNSPRVVESVTRRRAVVGRRNLRSRPCTRVPRARTGAPGATLGPGVDRLARRERPVRELSKATWVAGIAERHLARRHYARSRECLAERPLEQFRALVVRALAAVTAFEEPPGTVRPVLPLSSGQRRAPHVKTPKSTRVASAEVHRRRGSQSIERAQADRDGVKFGVRLRVGERRSRRDERRSRAARTTSGFQAVHQTSPDQ